MLSVFKSCNNYLEFIPNILLPSFFMLKLRCCTIINLLDGKFGDDMAYNMQFQSETEVCLFPQQMQDGFDV